MSQDDLRSLISDTPLDEPARDPTRRLGFIVIGLLTGGLIVIAAALAGAATDDTAPAAPTTAAPTVTTPPPDTAAFPEGFTAITDTVALRPLLVRPHGDELFVTIATATRRGLDPADTVGFHGGDFTLDGPRPVAMGRIIFDPALTGAFTVVFPTADGASASALRLTSLWNRSLEHLEMAFPLDSVPHRSEPAHRLDLGGGNGLIVESVELAIEGGSLEWTLDGPAAGAIVSATAYLREGFNDRTPIVMVAADAPAPFTSPALSQYATSGTIDLSRPGATIRQLFEAVIEWDVAWVDALPADVVIPLVDVGS